MIKENVFNFKGIENENVATGGLQETSQLLQCSAIVEL